MRNATPWTRFKRGIMQDLQRGWGKFGPARARVRDSWRPLSLACALLGLSFVSVGISGLIILAAQAFPWNAFSITALRQAPWHTGVIGSGFVLIGCMLLLWTLPKWKAARLNLSPREQFDVENESRKTWATIVGGMAVLFSLLFTWGNLQVTQENLRITQGAATKSQELTREGQITERFTKAIEQLGDDKIQIRLGGIYALERIARDSPRDHWPIMHILTAYVRDRARRKDALLLEEPNRSWDIPSLSEPAIDIQAVLVVLGNRPQIYNNGESRTLNLSNTDLRRASLGPQLQGVSFNRAQLQRAYFLGAELQEAHFWDAELQGAFFWAAKLQGAHFLRAQLQGADFRGARLQGARLTINQLATVKTLYRAQLDPPLMEEVKQKYPSLLEDPGD